PGHPRHCEQSEATQTSPATPGLLRRCAPRNDGGGRHDRATPVIASEAKQPRLRPQLLGCFVAALLAMTGGGASWPGYPRHYEQSEATQTSPAAPGLLRCARNDGGGAASGGFGFFLYARVGFEVIGSRGLDQLRAVIAVERIDRGPHWDRRNGAVVQFMP